MSTQADKQQTLILPDLDVQDKARDPFLPNIDATLPGPPLLTESDKEQIFILPELVEGKPLHLFLRNTSSASSTERMLLTCTIVKAFRPFTVSPVLLVSFGQPQPSTSLHDGISLPSSAILKLYDRRCLSNVRDQWDKDHPWWSLDKEREYREYLDDLATGAESPLDFDDAAFMKDYPITEDELEAYLQHIAQKVFNAERTTYERLRPLQGKKIPTLYGAVEYEIVIPGACPDGSAVTETISGLLLEYIPSLTLRELVTTWTMRNPPLPNGVLATLCDQVMKIVDHISDFDVLNEDVRMDNFLIREPFVSSSSHGEDPAVVEDVVVLVDLGNCRLRREDERVEAKCSQDEEGAAGVVLLRLVRVFVEEHVWTYKWSLRWDRPSEEEL